MRLRIRFFGMGAAMIALSAAYVGLAHAVIPHAGIITRVAQQIGGSAGTAVLAVVLQHTAGDTRTPGAPADAFGSTFRWSATCTATAVPLCLLLPGRPNRHDRSGIHPHPKTEPAPTP